MTKQLINYETNILWASAVIPIESMQGGVVSHMCAHHITGGKLIVYGSCFVSSCTFIETAVL